MRAVVQQEVLDRKPSASPQAVADLANETEHLEGKRLEDAQKEAEKVS